MPICPEGRYLRRRANGLVFHRLPGPAGLQNTGKGACSERLFAEAMYFLGQDFHAYRKGNSKEQRENKQREKLKAPNA